MSASAPPPLPQQPCQPCRQVQHMYLPLRLGVKTFEIVDAVGGVNGYIISRCIPPRNSIQEICMIVDCIGRCARNEPNHRTL